MLEHTMCPCAYAQIKGNGRFPDLQGNVKFYRKCGGVLVEVNIRGLPRDSETGFFALHIHEGDSCAGKNFSNTGGHYNPGRMSHPGHAGDLPPLISCGGRAYLMVWTDRFCIKDVVGRTVVIHSGSDDFHTQPAGNSGEKVGCGVICPMDGWGGTRCGRK